MILQRALLLDYFFRNVFVYVKSQNRLQQFSPRRLKGTAGFFLSLEQLHPAVLHLVNKNNYSIFLYK